MTALEALECAGRVYAFVPKPSDAPPRHDHLLWQMGQLQGSDFAPEACHQFASINGNDFTVHFVQGDKLYRLQARDREGAYDQERLLGAANAALRLSGSDQRFRAVASDDRLMRYVCMSDAQFQILCERFGVASAAAATAAGAAPEVP